MENWNKVYGMTLDKNDDMATWMYIRYHARRLCQEYGMKLLEAEALVKRKMIKKEEE